MERVSFALAHAWNPQEGLLTLFFSLALLQGRGEGKDARGTADLSEAVCGWRDLRFSGPVGCLCDPM